MTQIVSSSLEQIVDPSLRHAVAAATYDLLEQVMQHTALDPELEDIRKSAAVRAIAEMKEGVKRTLRGSVSSQSKKVVYTDAPPKSAKP